MSGPSRRNSSTETQAERIKAASYSPLAYHSSSCAISSQDAGSQLTCNTSWHLALHSYSHSVYGQWCQEQLWESVQQLPPEPTGYKGLTYGLGALLLIQPVSRPVLIVIFDNTHFRSEQSNGTNPSPTSHPLKQSCRYQDYYTWSSANNAGGSLTS